MTPSTILVTGGCGMIGSTLVKRLAREGHDVIVVDNLWRGKLAHLEEDPGKPVIDLRRRFHNRDLSHGGALDDLLPGVDYVVHLADIVAGIGYVFSNQGSIFRQNILINSNVVASVAAARGIKGYLYVGTACSFPADKQHGVEAPPLIEEDLYPAAPESAYGWSKLMGQYEAELMQKERGVPVALPILHNVYGAPCDISKERSQVVPALVRRAIEHRTEPFIVWGSGKQGRAFIHVDDVVEGLVASLERGFGAGPIQLGPDTCTPISTVAECIIRISGKPIDIHYDTTKPEGDRGRCADYAKARRVLGWSPKVELEDGLASLYRWVGTALEKNQKYESAAA
jgi:GDP-D-mannose 3', 5'-epimerase